MKTIVGFVSLFALAAVGYVAAGPYIAIYQIRSGVEARDAEKLSEYVDFSTLRTNLKDQFNTLVVQRATSDMKGNPFAALGIALASKLVEGMVDSFVTPPGLASLMTGEAPQQQAAEQEVTSARKQSEPFENARFTYDSSSKFSAWVPGDNGKEIRFVFSRTGLSWKLSNILLPVKMFEGSAPASAALPPHGRTQVPAPKPTEPPVFDVELRAKTFREADYREGIQDAITIRVAFHNLSGKDIRAFDGVLGFTDLLDNDILSAKLAISSSVAANATFDWTGEINYNPFMDSHQNLRNEELDNLKIHFWPRKILFADGTTKEFE